MQAINTAQILHLIDEFTNGLCEPLALQLHIRTGKPTYSIYDPNDKVMWWGPDYFHSFVKLGEDCYLNARGLHTKKQMIAYWADAWKNPELVDELVIVPREIILSGTGDAQIDRVLTEMVGDPRVIQPHTVQFADMLLKAHGIEC